METLRIGRTGMEVSRIGLGCVTFGREIDEPQSFRVLDRAFERGIRLFDTAEAYGGGQIEARRASLGLAAAAATAEMHSSEKILGRWMRANGVRGQVAVQTKVTRHFTRSHLRAALDASLERLQTDRVEVYLFHTDDRETPLQEAMEAMGEAVRSGKARALGASNFSAARLSEAAGIAQARGLPRIETIQPIYNLARREIEEGVLRFCREHEVTPIVYSPLGAGFLSGKYRAGEPLPPGARFDLVPGHADEYFSERNFALLERLRAVSARTGLPMPRLALGWVLAQPGVGVLIGARHERHIDAAAEAEASPLDPALAAELDSLAAA